MDWVLRNAETAANGRDKRNLGKASTTAEETRRFLIAFRDYENSNEFMLPAARAGMQR